MKERPILFSGAMVRALLDGSKTQTRRAMNRQPPEGCGIHYMLGDESWMPEDKRTPLRHHWEAWGGPLYEQRPDGHLCGTHSVRCPYGAPGDRLWVRETFFAWGHWTKRYNKKKRREEWHFVDETMGTGKAYRYEADETLPRRKRELHEVGWWKRPALFMHRTASRIALEITEVRVEPLQDISEADALAEGIVRQPDGGYGLADTTHYHSADPRQSYFSLWEAINGDGSVEVNPWVWVVAFPPPTTA